MICDDDLWWWFVMMGMRTHRDRHRDKHTGTRTTHTCSEKLFEFLDLECIVHANQHEIPGRNWSESSVLKWTETQKLENYRHGGSWLRRLPFQNNCENEFRKAGTWLQRPRIISVMSAALFVSAQTWDCPPAQKNCDKRGKIEVLHLFRCFTYTHTHALNVAHAHFATQGIRWFQWSEQQQ